MSAIDSQTGFVFVFFLPSPCFIQETVTSVSSPAEDKTTRYNQVDLLHLPNLILWTRTRNVGTIK